MIYLILAIISSACVSLFMRISENYITGKRGMLAMNYVMCCLLAVVSTGVYRLFPVGRGFGLTVGLGVFNGVLYLAGFILLQVNVKKNGVVLSATFMKLGLLVPMVVSISLFGEMPDMVQILGFFIAIGAIILMHFEKGQSTAGFKFGLILLLLAGGGGDAMAKIFEEYGTLQYANHFLLYTFFSACALCFLLVFIKKERIGVWETLFGLLIGIPNYFSAKFLLRSLETVRAVIVYPTYSVATLMIITLVGVCVFKEKLEKKQWLGLGLILLSLILLNINIVW